MTQEHRAEAAEEALRRSVAIRARVLRNGRPPRSRPKKWSPADGIVQAARAAQVNEALLTGEPRPVGKRLGALVAALAPADTIFGFAPLLAAMAGLVVLTWPWSRC